MDGFVLAWLSFTAPAFMLVYILNQRDLAISLYAVLRVNSGTISKFASLVVERNNTNQTLLAFDEVTLLVLICSPHLKLVFNPAERMNVCYLYCDAIPVVIIAMVAHNKLRLAD